MDLFKWLRKEPAPDNQMNHNFQVVVTNTGSARGVTPEEALKNPTVFSCVQLLASTISLMAWSVAHKGVSGFNPTEHPLNALLNKPNDDMTGSELKFQIVTDLLTYGNCYILKVKSGKRVISLVPINPSDIKQELSASGSRSYKFKSGRIYSSDEIIHIRDFIGGSSLGLSRVKQAAQLVAIDNAIDRQMADISEGGSNISGVVTFPEQVEPEVKKAFAEAWKNSFGKGGASKGSIAVLDGGASFTAVKGMSAVDSDLQKLKQQTTGRIAAVFRIPSVNLNVFDGAKYSNFSQQVASFYRDSVAPVAGNIADKLTAALIEDGDLAIEFDSSDLGKTDIISATAMAVQAKQSGIISANEARIIMGLPKSDSETANILASGSSTSREPSANKDFTNSNTDVNGEVVDA